MKTIKDLKIGDKIKYTVDDRPFAPKVRYEILEVCDIESDHILARPLRDDGTRYWFEDGLNNDMIEL